MSERSGFNTGGDSKMHYTAKDLSHPQYEAGKLSEE